MAQQCFQLISEEAWTLIQKDSTAGLVTSDRCRGKVLHITRCSLVTCVMKDTLLCIEGHWEVTGVGDLDDVGLDITKDNVAKVQDIFWQLDSEMVNTLSY